MKKGKNCVKKKVDKTHTTGPNISQTLLFLGVYLFQFLVLKIGVDKHLKSGVDKHLKLVVDKHLKSVIDQHLKGGIGKYLKSGVDKQIERRSSARAAPKRRPSGA